MIPHSLHNKDYFWSYEEKYDIIIFLLFSLLLFNRKYLKLIKIDISVFEFKLFMYISEVMIKSTTNCLFILFYFSSLNLKYLKLTKMDITSFAMKLNPQNMILYTKGHRLEVHCTNIQCKKCSSRIEIIHFKVKGLRGDYPNISQNSACKPCTQCKCAVVFSKVLSDPFVWKLYEVLFHYLMKIFFECWCNGLLNCVPIIYQHIFSFGYRNTLILQFSDHALIQY